MLIPSSLKNSIMNWIATAANPAKEPLEGEEKAFATSFTNGTYLYNVVVSFEHPEKILIKIRRKKVGGT